MERQADAKNKNESKAQDQRIINKNMIPDADHLAPLTTFQKALGNRALIGLIQAKLKMSQPNDSCELEADRVANQVTSEANPTKVAMNHIGIKPSDSLENTMLRKNSESGLTNSNTFSVLDNTSNSTGKPLDSDTKAYMEPRFGYDFSEVRIHDGSEAHESANAINANAFTAGKDIYFGDGQFTPDSHQGKVLLAHELAHVIQQNGGNNQRMIIQRKTAGSRNASEGSQVKKDSRDISLAIMELGAWKDKSDDFIDGVYEWLKRNWADFLTYTSFNPKLSMSEGQLQAITYQALNHGVLAGKLDGSVSAYESPFEAEKYMHVKEAGPDKEKGIALDSNGAKKQNMETYNPENDWKNGFLGNVASNAAGNMLDSEAEFWFGKGVGAAFKGVTPAISTALRFTVGVLIESCASIIFDAILGKKEMDEAMAQASEETGFSISSNMIESYNLRKKAMDSIEQYYDKEMEALTLTQTQQEVESILKRLKAEKWNIPNPPDLDDRSLYRTLIHDWILEHAVDEENSDDVTNQGRWERAVEIAKDPRQVDKVRKNRGLPPLPQVLDKGPDLDNHPELFIYQTRVNWSEYDLDCNGIINRMIEDVYGIRKTGKDVIDTVWKKYNKKTFHFEPKDMVFPYRFVRFIIDKTGHINDGVKECIRNNQFYVDCTLNLSLMDGTLYIDRFCYKIVLTGELPWYHTDTMVIHDKPQ